MTFDETLYGRHDDEMDDYGDGSYGESLEDEEYEEEEEEDEEPESAAIVVEEIEEERTGSHDGKSRAGLATTAAEESSDQTSCQESSEESSHQESCKEGSEAKDRRAEENGSEESRA